MTDKNERLMLLQADAAGALLGIADFLRNHDGDSVAQLAGGRILIACERILKEADAYLAKKKQLEGQ